VESASIAHGAHAAHEHHGPPEAHKSSRIDSQLLGVLLFIISEAMLFGSFFTAYFFVRVVQNEPWPPDPFEFPVLVASMNTAILVSSSFTVHYALHSIKKGNRLGLQAGFAISDGAFASVFYGLTGLHGAHVFVGLTLLAIMNVRAARGHFTPDKHMGVETAGIYWHFVDVMWIIVWSTVYLL
jgi:cytochrome c oxidase subunit 3